MAEPMGTKVASAPKAMALAGRGLGRRIGERWVWRGLEFELPPGQILGLEGPSGSGKTLLLRALAGLDSLDEGELLIDGAPLDERELPLHRTRVAYLSQRPSLFPGTVEDNLRLPFELAAHARRRFDRPGQLERLRSLGRDESFLDQPASQLSGGELHVTALLRALQLEPQVLLLDEPTAALDPGSTETIEALIRSHLDADPKRAALWSSHDPDQLDRVADRRLLLESGS